MFRVSPQELKTYLGLMANDDTDVTIFLEMGNILVDDELVGKGLSTNRLKMIELNLAAHYGCIAVEKGGLTRQKVGDSEEGYRQDFSSRPNLSMTRYGQQAVALDTSGTLSGLDAPKGKAEFRVVEKTKSTQGLGTL